jgi:hypothetical protein
MQRVFLKQRNKEVTREWSVATDTPGELPYIIEHIHTPHGRFEATYEFIEFLTLATDEPGEQFRKFVGHSLFPEGLRVAGPLYPGSRKPRPAPKYLKSFPDDRFN